MRRRVHSDDNFSSDRFFFIYREHDRELAKLVLFLAIA